MEEIILSRAEFLVLLDALGATAVVGIDPRVLFPESLEEQRALVEQGQQMLEARGLLVVAPDGVRALDPRLALIAQTVARPELASISTRSFPDGAQQLILHYATAGRAVEQTFPAPGQHRLALLPDLSALIDRLLVVFPAPPEPAPAQSFTLAPELLAAAQAQAEAGDTSAALTRLEDAGVAREAAAPFVGSLAAPLLAGTIALLRCEGEEIVDARNPALLLSRQLAWSIAQATPGRPPLQVTRVDAARLRAQLAGWLDELRAPTSSF